MHPIRFAAAPLACLVLVASFTVDAFATESPSDDGPSVSPLHKRHVSKRPANGPQAPASGDGAEHGNASYYAHHLSGHRTASGQAYDPSALTAAHRTLPIGTQVRVVNPKNEKSVVVTVNDRGPMPKNRVIDVSSAAADRLGMKKAGVTKVETQVVQRNDAPKDDPVATVKDGASAH